MIGFIPRVCGGNSQSTLMQESNVWYICDSCKKKIMKELGIKEDYKDGGNRDSAGDTESEDEGTGTKTEAPKENNTVRSDPEPNQQKEISDEHSYVRKRNLLMK